MGRLTLPGEKAERRKWTPVAVPSVLSIAGRLLFHLQEISRERRGTLF